MNAPCMVTPERFNELVDEFLEQSCIHTGKELLGNESQESVDYFKCKYCGSDIKWHRTFLSVHDAGFGGCAGFGEVLNPTIPFCPVCEPRPQVFGCVHRGQVNSVTFPPPSPTLFKRFLARLFK